MAKENTGEYLGPSENTVESMLHWPTGHVNRSAIERGAHSFMPLLATLEQKAVTWFKLERDAIYAVGGR